MTPPRSRAQPAGALPYQDPSLPVKQRVQDLLSRMKLAEKIGQMTQAERGSVSNADITNFALGSVLSGGGSAPSPNTATSWANMYDGFQNAALNSREPLESQTAKLLAFQPIGKTPTLARYENAVMREVVQAASVVMVHVCQGHRF